MCFFFSQTMVERPKRPDSHAYIAILADGDGDDEKSTGFFRYSDFLLTFVGDVGGDGVLHRVSSDFFTLCKDVLRNKFGQLD